MYSFWHHPKNIFVYIFKLELEIGNLESDSHSPIWKKITLLVEETYFLYNIDFENTIPKLRQKFMDHCLY